LPGGPGSSILSAVSTAGNYAATLRDDRDSYSRLALALVISLLLHALLYSGYRFNQRYHWLNQVTLPAWLTPARHFLPPPATPLQANPTPELTLVPLEFVEVNPATATAEAPKEAKYYSTANSHAANAQADRESNVPKITGTETRMVRTETVTHPAAQPLRPNLAMAKPTLQAPAVTAPTPPDMATPRTQESQEELKPKATQAPGDLVMARPGDLERKGEGQADQPRPRTLKEAVSRLAARDPAAAAGLVGQQMRQDGGVKRRNLVSSLDVKSSPFGAYDAAIIYAVQNRWYSLLDAKGYAGESTGKVTLKFRLHADGHVDKMDELERTVDDLLGIICQRAILDNAPFDRWPSDMRRLNGAEFRDVTFTFYYQ
jgi:hypothetical protein